MIRGGKVRAGLTCALCHAAIDKDTDRILEGAKPSEFLQKGDPTPTTPAINKVIKMPGFPKGSLFIVDGLMAGSPGLPVGAQINGLSA